MSQASTKPVKVLRYRGVRASIFANQAKTEGGEVTVHKVSLLRIYRDGKEFKTTTSFSRDDLPIAQHLLHKCWEFILETEQNAKKQHAEAQS